MSEWDDWMEKEDKGVERERFVKGLDLDILSFIASFMDHHGRILTGYTVSYIFPFSSYTPISKSSLQGTSSPHLKEHCYGPCPVPAPASGCDLLSYLPANSETNSRKGTSV